MLAVTTFHPRSYTLYAKRCIEGLVKFFPGKVVAYYEEKPDPIEGVEFRDYFSIKDSQRFLDRIKRVDGSDGMMQGQYDFRYDAKRFCRKVFAQEAVFDEDDLVFWIDSDCDIKQQITEEFLKGLLDRACVAYMGRKHSYTETGFVGFNTKHRHFQTFRDRYLSFFTSGRIFQQLKGWHDCIAFDEARQGLSGRDLTPNGWGYGSVIQDSILEPYIDHYKGNRKFRADPRAVSA